MPDTPSSLPAELGPEQKIQGTHTGSQYSPHLVHAGIAPARPPGAHSRQSWPGALTPPENPSDVFLCSPPCTLLIKHRLLSSIKDQGEWILFRAKGKFKRAINRADCNAEEIRNRASTHHRSYMFLPQSPHILLCPHQRGGLLCSAWSWQARHMHVRSMGPAGTTCMCACSRVCVAGSMPGPLRGVCAAMRGLLPVAR